MEEPNQVEPEQIPEQYRDPQIDELIEVLRRISLHLFDVSSIAHSLSEISGALYAHDFTVPETLSDKIASESGFVVRRTNQIELLRNAIERLRPVPWYVRVVSWFGVKRVNSEFAKMANARKEREKARVEHMQRLAENAGKLNSGRFKGRYS